MGMFFAKNLIIGSIVVILASCGTPPVEDPTQTLPAEGIFGPRSRGTK